MSRSTKGSIISKSKGKSDKSQAETPQELENRIRELAYLKWQAAGSPAGDGVNFWLQAEQEITGGTAERNEKQ
jgi:hypothetical protein